MRSVRMALIPLLFSVALGAQTAPRRFADPVQLLRAVAQNYAKPGATFRIEQVTETVRNSAYIRQWEKQDQVVIQGPGNLYRIEARSQFGSWLQVSDGRNEWVYFDEGHVYSKHPIGPDWPSFPKALTIGIMDLPNAWRIRSTLEMMADQFTRAEMLKPETIELDGRKYRCYVVHAKSEDSANKPAKDFHDDITVWIDRDALVIRKSVEHIDSFMYQNPAVHVPNKSDVTRTYPVVEFQAATTPAMFEFTPPSDAKEIATFEPNFPSLADSMHPKAKLAGEPAPQISWLGADGKKMTLSSYRGRPVLVDMWATWCGPCIASMPNLSKIFEETRSTPLQILTFDEDSSAQQATNFLARHSYAWTNVHDEGGAIQKAFKGEGIPLVALIDANGKVVFYDFGTDEAGLRKAIAALGPQYASALSAKNGTAASAP